MTKKPTKLEQAIRESLAEQARLESIAVVGFTPPRPKLTPGSLPMPDGPPSDDLEGLDADDREAIVAMRDALPPWTEDGDDAPAEQPSSQAVAAALKKYRAAKSKMRAARKEVEALKPTVRDEAFEYWIRRYVVNADSRAEWTISTVLYANYLAHAGEHGGNRGDKATTKLERASQTRFGILLREAGFLKERRSRPNGNYYPLRLKQGA